MIRFAAKLNDIHVSQVACHAMDHFEVLLFAIDLRRFTKP